MRIILFCMMTWAVFINPVWADYKRNEAVPVNQVLFGQVTSVRNITEQELIEDRNQGWKVFGGALVGGAIGNQFGGGSGKAIATILGAIIGGTVANDSAPAYQQISLHLVELMITTDDGHAYMVIQDFDRTMPFHAKDKVRMIYLADNSVRVDKQM